MSRIEQMISDIESYIDNCKFQPLSNTKIIVNKEQLEDMLNELRLKTPEEVKKYQKILNNKDAIIADAKEQAETIVNAAQIRTEELINEHEIMQRAYAQANALIEQATAQAQQILDSATEDANSIRQGAMDYTDDMLEKLQYIIERSIRDNREKYDSLLAGLNNMLSIVNNNRNELKTPVEEEESTPEEKTDEPETSEEAPVLEDVTEEEATDILEQYINQVCLFSQDNGLRSFDKHMIIVFNCAIIIC